MKKYIALCLFSVLGAMNSVSAKTQPLPNVTVIAHVAPQTWQARPPSNPYVGKVKCVLTHNSQAYWEGRSFDPSMLGVFVDYYVASFGYGNIVDVSCSGHYVDIFNQNVYVRGRVTATPIAATLPIGVSLR